MFKFRKHVQHQAIERSAGFRGGRLVLCDLLAEAAEESPDWLIDAATLTGAARGALGPDLPALSVRKMNFRTLF
jgi:leucyl aminopeptidase